MFYYYYYSFYTWLFSASDPVTSVISTQLPYPVSTSDGEPIVLTFEVINKVMNINLLLTKFYY